MQESKVTSIFISQHAFLLRSQESQRIQKGEKEERVAGREREKRQQRGGGLREREGGGGGGEELRRRIVFLRERKKRMEEYLEGRKV